jgi:hypothetical protein
MRVVASVLAVTALVLSGCIQAPAGTTLGTSPSATPSAAASAAPSPTASATPSPTNSRQARWQTYVSTRWAYSIGYPGDWYNLASFGLPDTQKYFANENVGAPLEMSSTGVWESIEVQTNTASCPPSYLSDSVLRQSPITVGGVPATRLVINMTAAAAEASYITGVWVKRNGRCYSIQFLSQTAAARDANAGLADQIIASFRFLG